MLCWCACQARPGTSEGLRAAEAWGCHMPRHTRECALQRRARGSATSINLQNVGHAPVRTVRPCGLGLLG